MTRQEIALLLQYKYNMQTKIEREIQQRTSVIRYRDFDENDLIELLLAKERLNTLRVVLTDVYHILNLFKYTDDIENTV